MNRRSFLTITLPALAGATAFGETLAADKPLRFGVIADPQYADVPTTGTRHYRASLAKLDACIAELNQRDLAFVVTLGDLIDRDFASFDAVIERYAKLKAPHRIVLGNHDFSVADAEKENVLGKLGMKLGYQSFVVKDWRFVLIDGTETAPYRFAANDPRAKAAKDRMKALAAAGVSSAQPHNGVISAEQLQWIEKELQSARAAKQRAILCGHFPVMPIKDAHNLWNADEVVAVIDRFPEVAAYLNGHNHHGNYAHAGHCHYVNFKGMVETASDNAFAVVSCYPDRITIEGFGPEPSRERLD